MQKNAIAVAKWSEETQAGRASLTVRAPRSACSTTSTAAPTPSRLSSRSARLCLKIIPHSTNVIVATVEATSRCVCSNCFPSTIFGISLPSQSGQSGQASPDSVVLTRPPATSKQNVASAVATAKR